MFDTLLHVCIGLLAIGSLCGLYRAVVGPTLLDRILALDTISIAVIGIVALLSISSGSVYFIELIIVFSLIAFISTVAFIYISRYFMDSDELAGPRSPEVPTKGDRP